MKYKPLPSVRGRSPLFYSIPFRSLSFGGVSLVRLASYFLTVVYRLFPSDTPTPPSLPLVVQRTREERTLPPLKSDPFETAHPFSQGSPNSLPRRTSLATLRLVGYFSENYIGFFCSSPPKRRPLFRTNPRRKETHVELPPNTRKILLYSRSLFFRGRSLVIPLVISDPLPSVSPVRTSPLPRRKGVRSFSFSRVHKYFFSAPLLPGKGNRLSFCKEKNHLPLVTAVNPLQVRFYFPPRIGRAFPTLECKITMKASGSPPWDTAIVLPFLFTFPSAAIQ